MTTIQHTKNITKHLLLLMLMFFCQSLPAQELTVKSMQLLPDDASAMVFENQRQDLNDNYAGIVKVMLAVNGAKFMGGGLMEQKQYEMSEYWVWMAKDSKRLKIYVPGYLPLEVNFFNDFGIKVESKRTYEMVVTLPMGYTPTAAQMEATFDMPPSIPETEMTPAQMVEKGEDYYYGRNGVEKDYSEAVKWYRKAAERGDATGQVNLGYMYKNGLGVEKDFSEAVKWYRMAAEQGDADGQTKLGYMYRDGLGVEKDYSEALKWYRMASEQGDADGQVNLGYMYHVGLGVEKDYNEAMKWYRLSAEQGNVTGQVSLGYMFERGIGVEKNYSEAAKWYRLAAEQGEALAQYNLGVMHQNGYGVETDLTKAKYWLEKAAAQGFEYAKQALEQF